MAPVDDPPYVAGPRRRRSTTGADAWARAFGLGSLVHLTLPDVQQAGWFAPALLEGVGALALLVRPSAWAFLLCAVGTLWPLLWLRDVLTQSVYLTLAALVGAWAWARREPRAALGPVTALTGLLYLVAALHKLNSGFFEPSTSCAQHAFAQVQARWSHWLPGAGPDVPGAWLAAAVVAIEVLIGALVLLRSPLRWPLGLAFHLPLTVTLAPAFGPIMLSGYAAACAPREAARWRRALRSPSAWALAVAAAGVALAVDGRPMEDAWVTAKVVGAGALGGLALVVLRSPMQSAWRVSRVTVVVSFAWLALGLSPYTGLNYQHAGAMLSNLRVDRECANSWLFGRPPFDMYLRVDQVSIGNGQRRAREETVRATLWGTTALHVMHENWCIDELRPIRMSGTWRGRDFTITDLCAPDWAEELPDLAFGVGFLPSHQALQKNLLRACTSACVH